jgi:hypothetical protein
MKYRGGMSQTAVGGYEMLKYCFKEESAVGQKLKQ